MTWLIILCVVVGAVICFYAGLIADNVNKIVRDSLKSKNPPKFILYADYNTDGLNHTIYASHPFMISATAGTIEEANQKFNQLVNERLAYVHSPLRFNLYDAIVFDTSNVKNS